MLKRALNLNGNEPARMLPFFGVYFLLFAALTLADGLSLSLFVQRVGAAALPRYYGLIALTTLVVNLGYVRLASRVEASLLLGGLAFFSGSAFLAAWLGVLAYPDRTLFYGLLFVTRELSYVLFLMHFGTFLQEYFTRDELMRVMPIVYAGGRVGGIVGGFGLEKLSPIFGLLPLLLVCAGAVVASGLLALLIARRVAKVRAAEDLLADPGLAPGRNATADELDREARHSLGGFLRFVRHSPLMFWNTVTTLVFVACRWVLNYQYNGFFEQHFATDVAMAAFIGRYTQVALALALVLQVFLVSRMVKRFGIRGTQLGYAALVCMSFGLNAGLMSLPTALLARLVENELRLGLRNPLNQLLINKFSKPLRIRVRAFGIGFLNPVATFGTSGLLILLAGWTPVVAGLGILLGGSYLAGIVGVNRSFVERVPPPDRDARTADHQPPTANSG